MTMTMQPVKSSNIREVGYDPDTRTLHVNFGMATYAYKDVSPEAHAAFLAAPSAGKHFAEHIKPKHECTKLPKAEGVAHA